ncbi:cytochrome-c peroxidase [Fulvivirga sediminis]|uniref:C-type cytochrome n=1 Tax=Fulvivirga sediminis TaxID=2803949 RepID=A0A937F827_9BACT|nr:cytochrome c peroxidase [Fulvivirga sediminis]MBL3656014.1 c-type cytochrome [Fulvivirga sediminis]
MNRVFILLTISILFIVACGNDDDQSTNYWQVDVPEYFPEMVYTIENNPVTKEGFELGRMLFYETRLSSDNTVSCANCHQPYLAFADPVHVFSVGVNNQKGTRNAPPIFNLAFQSHFFWDGGVNHVDFIPINPIMNKLEMNESISNVVKKVNELPEYQDKFKQVFGKDSVNGEEFLHAFSQFLVMLVSDNAYYDQWMQGKYELNEAELRGMKLYESKCADCHGTALFTDGSFRNNGLDAEFSKDLGRAIITEYAGDEGKFKVPTLRNLAYTAPYMHDGRFETLEEVLDHYDHRVVQSATLDPLLVQANGELGIPMTDQEKSDIIAFLHTLTDRDFVSDSRFFDPN